MAAPGRKKGPAPKKSKPSRPASQKTAPAAVRQTAAQPAGEQVLPRNGLGTTGLVLGVLAVVASPTIAFGVILGVPAMVVGFLALKRVRAGGATNFRSSVTAIALGAVALAVVVGLLLYGRHVLNTPAGKRYTACLDAAGDDRDKREVCEDVFERER